MQQLIELIKSRLADQNGVTAVEYAMIVGLIALVLIPTLVIVGNFLNGEFAGITW